MTQDKVMRATWAKFGECVGYLVLDDPMSAGLFRVHIEPHPMEKKYLAPLYIPGRGVPGDSKHLLPVHDILHRIYLEVLNLKGGNIYQIHGFMIDLLLLTHQNRGSSLRLDVMDFIWNEIQWGLCHKKRPPFAPFVMHLICVCWAAKFDSDLLTLRGTKTVRHPMKELRKKHHEEPMDGPGAAAGGEPGATT
jgi:hypothetical protein